MNVTGSARLAGVIGWPVAHSLSPRLHGFWLAEHGIDGLFLPLRVATPDFGRAIAGLQAAGFGGVSVTVPHKEAAFALAHEHDRAAHATGAVNLLVFGGDGRLAGRNTDAEGLAASLGESLGPLKGKTAVIAGAGGAARAAAFALAGLGLAAVRIVNRSRSRAETLVRTLAAAQTKLEVCDWGAWDTVLADADLYVNATTLGMRGGEEFVPPLDRLAKGAAVADLVYSPRLTPLLAAAARRGLATVDGLGMLMHQGVPAFEAFYGVRPRVTRALRAHLERALGDG